MQHLIDPDQELPSHRCDGLPVPLPLGQTQIALAQRTGTAHGVEGVLDQDPPQVPTPLTRDSSSMARVGALVDPRSQSGIADQLLGCREAGDLPNLRQNEQRREDPDTRDRPQAIRLRVLLGDETQLLINSRNLAVEELQMRQAIVSLPSKHGRQGDSGQVILALSTEGICPWARQVDLSQNRGQPVLHPGAVMHQAHPVTQELSQVSNRRQGNITRRQQVGSLKIAEHLSVNSIRLNPCRGNRANFQGMSQFYPATQPFQRLIYPNIVGRSFQGDHHRFSFTTTEKSAKGHRVVWNPTALDQMPLGVF